jgi:hypothetical protein
MPVDTLTAAVKLVLQPDEICPQEIGALAVLVAAAPLELDVPCTLSILDGATTSRTESAGVAWTAGFAAFEPSKRYLVRQ